MGLIERHLLVSTLKSHYLNDSIELFRLLAFSPNVHSEVSPINVRVEPYLWIIFTEMTSQLVLEKSEIPSDREMFTLLHLRIASTVNTEVFWYISGRLLSMVPSYPIRRYGELSGLCTTILKKVCKVLTEIFSWVKVYYYLKTTLLSSP